MKIRAMRVLGVLSGLLLVSAETCGSTEPPPDTCVTGQTLTVGADITGAVAQGDCVLPNADGTRGDSYAFTLASQSFLRLNVSGSTETKIRIRDNGKSGDLQEVVLMEVGQAEYQAFTALPAGSYTLDIASDDEAPGTYAIKSAMLTPPEQPVGCIVEPSQMRFATIGTTIQGQITGTDCAASGTNKADNYYVRMPAGAPRKITVTVPANTSGYAVEIRKIGTPTLVTNPGTRNSAGDIVVQFTPNQLEYYSIGIITIPGANPLIYTIKVE
jgi:hypothetical protein